MTNPQFYSEASLLEDADYQPSCIEEPEPLGEEEEDMEEEQRPLPILDPSGTHLRTLPTKNNSEDLSSERLRESLDEHLGMIINQAFEFPDSD